MPESVFHMNDMHKTEEHFAAKLEITNSQTSLLQLFPMKGLSAQQAD